MTSHNKHVRHHFLLFRNVVSRALRSWSRFSTCLCLLSWRKGVVVQEPSQEQRGGARQGIRWCSRSTQQILDVSAPFISEHRLESPVAQIVERGRRRAWCKCWNASRTGHLKRSLIVACESMTIVGSCTDQCHTASVLVYFLSPCGHLLEIEIAKEEDRPWFPSVPALSEQFLWI